MRHIVRKPRITILALWSGVLIRALGGVGHSSVIVGASPWQYVYLLRRKRGMTIPSSYAPAIWADCLAVLKLPKAYGVADWDTVQAYSTRRVSLEGYIAKTLRMPDGDLHVHLRSTPSLQCFPKGHREAQIVWEIHPVTRPEVWDDDRQA